MIEAISAELKNVVYFNEAAIDYTDNCGLVIVSGSNQDSRLSKKQNNGAGKSLFFSIIPNIAYESTPLAAQKRSRKDLMSKSSEARFTIKNNGHVYEVVQTASKYTIFRDGVDLEARTINIQREWIQKIFPLSEDEFYSYVYLQSQRNLEFQVGTPRSRLSYITSVWRLEQYDLMRKYFEKRLSDVKNAQTEFDVLTTQLLQLNSSFEKLGWNSKQRKELEAANEVVQNLSDSVKELQAEAAKLRSLKEQVDFYQKTKSALAKIKKKIKHTKAELKDAYRAIQEHETYKQELATYKRNTAKLTEKIEQIGEVEFGAAQKKKLTKAEAFIEENEQTFRDMKRKKDEYAECKAELVEFEDDDYSLIKPILAQAKKAGTHARELISEELGMVNTTLSLEELIHEHEEGGECPTCLQSIDVEKIKKSVKHARKRKQELQEQLALLKRYDERKRIVERLKGIEFNNDDFEGLRDKLKRAAAVVEELEELSAKAEKLSEYKEALAEIEKPTKPKSEITLSEEEIEQQSDLLTQAEKLKERLEEFDEEPTVEGIDDQLAVVEKRFKKVETQYTKAFSVTVELGARQSEAKLLRRQIADMEKQLEAIKPLIEQRDMLKTLTQAYGSKGLKLNAVNQVLLQLEQNLNRFASLIFAEPFKFQVFAKEDGVHVLVDRQHGKISDVRLLSGAESDSFRLLYLLASLVMVGDDRRTNFVVLDEPDSHMDDVTRSIFIERYIPFLRTLVPHVFVITPNSKHLYSNCDYLTVVKKNGVSRIVKGQ